jgi:hypothetical protein
MSARARLMTDSSVECDVHRPYDPPMEDRAARLEEDMRDVKSVLPRLEPIIRIDATLTATLPNLATKAELAELRTEVTKEIEDLRVGLTKEIADVRTELRKEIMDVRTDLGKEIADLRNEMTDRFADVPTKTYLWGILAAGNSGSADHRLWRRWR